MVINIGKRIASHRIAMELNEEINKTLTDIIELDDQNSTMSNEAKSKLEIMQQELHETKVHMAKNVEKLLKRESKLEDVDEKTRALVKQSDIFTKGCKKLTWYTWFYSKISYIFAGGATSLAVLMYLVL